MCLQASLLLPLPATPWELAIWQKATVNIDYRVAVEKDYYSALYQAVRDSVG